MKIILTGSTGFIGQEVLHQCLSHPSITSIIALTRRPLPITSPKLKSVTVEDFLSYSPALMQELSNADACIWALGVKSGDVETQRRVGIEYMMAAAEAFARLGEENGRPFRVVFTSGILAVKDQEKPIWFLGEGRKIKGDIENQLLAFADKHADSLDAYITRPSVVLGKSGVLAELGLSLLPAVKVDHLAAAMIDLAMNGGEKKIIENGPLGRQGALALKIRG